MATDLIRRKILSGALAAAAVPPVFGQNVGKLEDQWPKAGPDRTGTPQEPVQIEAPDEPVGLLSKEVIELWPAGQIPGVPTKPLRRLVLERGSPSAHDRAVMHVSRPILEVFRPKRPNGAAMIVCPGGGYVRLAIDKEGAGSVHPLTEAGVTTFVLNYRLPEDGWAAGYDCALQDAQRAIRLVRARAAHFGIDAARQEGGHGFGFSLAESMPASRWPQDWRAWAQRIGFLAGTSAKGSAWGALPHPKES